MVSFRPMRKNKFNKDQPYPFAARVFSSEDMSGPWRTPEAFPQKEEVSGLVTIGLTRSKDEENGGANETFLLTVGPEPNTAAILVSQGAHGLHAELHRLDQLGEKHLGGLLGTEDRSNTEEEPAKECVAMQANRTRLMMEERSGSRGPGCWPPGAEPRPAPAGVRAPILFFGGAHEGRRRESAVKRSLCR
ncbi:unnamed protein product [Prorocentrum cordatum]|uniref:Uncharacterized protein n=1 Tax=Prorocentrum cordatum TaxID=2364126 RepID=A0ABN9PEH4_9DINO|nr:unnamed protein product [Polarella glacialis]